MKGGNRQLIRLVLILVVAGALYLREKRKPDTPEEVPVVPRTPAAEQIHGYDVFRNSRLIPRDNNDGDSFFVDLGDREMELRLYFVDAPEKYLSDYHQKQQARVADQAKDLGGISTKQAVEIGNDAKLYVEHALGRKTFTVYTYWEAVYDSGRYYGFVELPNGEDLGTQLVANGLARIHTKGPGSKESPVPTPAGKSFHQHRDHLFELERQAKRDQRGAWGL